VLLAGKDFSGVEEALWVEGSLDMALKGDDTIGLLEP
jgi:hypothetical protein